MNMSLDTKERKNTRREEKKLLYYGRSHVVNICHQQPCYCTSTTIIIVRNRQQQSLSSTTKKEGKCWINHQPFPPPKTTTNSFFCINALFDVFCLSLLNVGLVGSTHTYIIFSDMIPYYKCNHPSLLSLPSLIWNNNITFQCKLLFKILQI